MDESKNSQSKAPLVEALCEYAGRDYGRFHIPGHKGKRPHPAADCLPEELFRYDVTELPGLDDLGSAEGPILFAQQLAAELFGASETLFLVGGASAGIVASLTACTGDKSRVCLPRNSHRSTVSALLQADARPVWVPTEYTEDMLPMPVGLDRLRKTARDAGAEVILALSPTFEGMTAYLDCAGPEVVVVDEAHGSHFAFAEGFPKPALTMPVDAVVHGAHKTFGSLTSTAFLHLKGTRFDVSRVRQALAWIHTTSPSYPLMASLDAARRQMALHGHELLTCAKAEAENARDMLKRAGIDVNDLESGTDPLRLVIPSAQFGLSGHMLEAVIRSKGIMLEYAGLTHVLAVFAIGDGPGSGGLFAKRVIEAVGSHPQRRAPDFSLLAAKTAGQWLRAHVLPHQVMTPREAWLASSRTRLPIREAEGRVAAESLFPYPPGSPILVQGEVIPPGFAEAIDLMKKAGAHFQGASDMSLATIQVVHDGAGMA